MWQPPSKKGAKSLHIDTEASKEPTQTLPSIAAAFLVKFDMRKGYTIAWEQSLPEVDLEGVVEYKSFPSGLHNVKEDLVYFIHKDYAGISAFLNEPAAESHRNATMISVGVLVPLHYGRLGKCWLHAENLKELARQQIKDMDKTSRLAEYYEQYRLQNSEASEEHPSADSPISYRPSTSNGHIKGSNREHAISDGAGLVTGHQALSPYHPALSLSDLVASFGPLLFPLYRATLLRKRILVVGEAPVHRACDFVYDLSVMASVPRQLSSLLPVDGTPALRMQPLFNIGVQDIPQLSERNTDDDSAIQSSPNWIACTTDDVLATKPELFDLLVVLPPSYAEAATRKVYPKLVESSPSLLRSFPKVGLKATQRDARRYQALRAGMRSMRSGKPGTDEEALTDDDDAKSVASQASTLSRTTLVESTPWSVVAYTSILWWASAGEKRSGPMEQEEVEQEQDRELLVTAADTMEDSRQEIPLEIALISYFHRLTSLIFTTISDAISRQDGEEVRRNGTDVQNGYRDADAGDHAGADNAESSGETLQNGDEDGPLLANEARQEGPLEISQDDMTAMGLDVWSAADRIFVEELTKLWWGRALDIKGGRVECCGVRLS